MLERYITRLATDDGSLEESAVTRERLKSRFAPGATRRMTLLGMLVGSVLEGFSIQEADTLVYASAFGESRALEAYLDSFPEASPTLFQTSIHPSGVQQGLVGRQRSIHQLFPHAGGRALPSCALRTAFLATSNRVILCGGEERASWMTERGVASDRTFAYALALSSAPGASVLGKIQLSTSVEQGQLSHLEWFALLCGRRPFAGAISGGVGMRLTWI